MRHAESSELVHLLLLLIEVGSGGHAVILSAIKANSLRLARTFSLELHRVWWCKYNQENAHVRLKTRKPSKEQETISLTKNLISFNFISVTLP